MESVNSGGYEFETDRKISADDEDEAACCLLFLLQPACKLYAAQLAAVFVEQHNGVGRLQLL